MPKPDFIIIGAPRSGTSWLYTVLRKHPSVHMPRIKELHFFDRSPDYPSPSFLYPERLIDRWKNKSWREKAIKESINAFRKKAWDDFKWEIKWYFSNYNLKWYQSLFKERFINGEATPAYSLLEKKDIEIIKALNPNVKLIYILRNPIERDWSSYKKYLRKNSPFQTQEEFDHFFGSGAMQSRSNYQANIERYRSVFDHSQLFIAFYDDIIENPSRFIEVICDYLKINFKDYGNSVDFSNRVNSTSPMGIEPMVLEVLRNRYAIEIKELSKYLNNPEIEHWIDYGNK